MPDEVDTTALTALALRGKEDSSEQIKKTVEKILQNTNEEGIIQVYFPPREKRENRIDHTVCASAMRLIYQLGYDDSANKTEDYMYGILKDQSYLDGSYFFPSPDAFLYYLYKAIVGSKQALERFRPLLTENVKSRLNSTARPLDLAMRIIMSVGLGLLKDEQIFSKVNQEKQTLESLQKEDGSWPKYALYKAGRSDIYFGSKSISTAFAVNALQMLQQSPEFGQDLTPAGERIPSRIVRDFA